jgi:hypothetical protein
MQQPKLELPFQCWLYPLTPLVVGGISIAFLVATSIGDPLSSLIAAGLAALGLVALLRSPDEPLNPV